MEESLVTELPFIERVWEKWHARMQEEMWRMTYQTCGRVFVL
jgi:hypothetical protein